MKKLLSFVAAILFAATTFAQVDEVTLTTIGNGKTEEEATLRALRNALEQTFGTFVSANTSIINDELARDEITATSKGNVKEYKKLSVVKLPDRTTTVTLKATVSINKLISYARNNGSRAEFAGQTFAMNVKLLKLQQQNANKTLDVMKDNVIALCHRVFDYDIKLGELKKEKVYRFTSDDLYRNDGFNSKEHNTSSLSEYILPFTLDVYSSDVTTNIYSLITETFNAIRLSPSMVQDFDRNDMVHFGDIPVSQSYIDEIFKCIVQAIMTDFINFKLRKINSTEYYALKKYDTKAICFNDYTFIRGFFPSRYVWLFSNHEKNLPIAILTGKKGHDNVARNGIAYDYGKYPKIEGLISISTLRHSIDSKRFGSSFSKWNTNIDGQIYQQKLCSFDLCILLTDAEVERFNGLELVGVTSPKYTSVPKPDMKKEAVKGYKKMSDLPLNSPVKITGIRILTGNLPKKTYTISMTSKGSNGQQTYKIYVGEKRVEGLFWEFNGDAIASAFPNEINARETKDYIDMQIVMGEYTIKKFPKELSDVVYFK